MSSFSCSSEFKIIQFIGDSTSDGNSAQMKLTWSRFLDLVKRVLPRPPLPCAQRAMASPYDAAKAQFSLPITELDYVCSRDLVAFLTRSPKMSSDFDLRPVTRFSGMFDVSPRGFGEVPHITPSYLPRSAPLTPRIRQDFSCLRQISLCCRIFLPSTRPRPTSATNSSRRYMRKSTSNAYRISREMI